MDAALALLVLGLAIWITVVRVTYSAAVGFVAYGLLLTIIWVRLPSGRRGNGTRQP